MIHKKNNTFLFFSQWFNRSKEANLSYSTMSIIIVMSISTTVAEMFGLGIFLPIFQYMKTDGDLEILVSESVVWEYIISIFKFASVDISLLALLFISFFFFMGRQVFTYMRVVFKSAVTYRLVKELRDKLFSKYLNADTAFHDSTSIGSISNVIVVESIGAIQTLMQPLEMVTYLIMAIGYLSILFLLSWQMTAVSIIVLSFASLAPSVWIKRSSQVGRGLVKANIKLSAFLLARLKSPRLVRLASTQQAEKDEFNRLTQNQRKKSTYSSILLARTDSALEPLIIGLSLIFLYISYTHFNMQIEMIGLYLVVALRMMPVSKGIISQWQSIQSSLGSMEIVENKLDSMEVSKEIDTGVLQFNKIKQSVDFLDVSYCYPIAEDDALKNITIKFKVNEITAIVGPSGSGKSTLIDLLPRLRLPKVGSIRVDGIDIAKYKLKSLRQLIAYVPQFPQIFDGTIRNHIHYGKSDASSEEIIEAARLAGAEDFINQLPKKFDTELGEDAVRLSGGQRQRLDLARALLAHTSILILDEPTSNLDAESEEMFKRVLTQIHKDTNTIIIVISHRLASIVDAEQIIVMNKGNVEMLGTHSELLNKKGWYAEAWTTQNPITK